MADALVARPAGLIATALGSVIFVFALPFAAASKSVHRTAHALIAKPAHATFHRPMGDFNTLSADGSSYDD